MNEWCKDCDINNHWACCQTEEQIKECKRFMRGKK